MLYPQQNRDPQPVRPLGGLGFPGRSSRHRRDREMASGRAGCPPHRRSWQLERAVRRSVQLSRCGLVCARISRAPRLEGPAHLRARRLGQLRGGDVGQRAEGGRALGRPSALRMRHHRHRRVGRAEHAGDPRGERAQAHACARRQHAAQGRRRDGDDVRLSQHHLRFLPLRRAAPTGVALRRPADAHHRHRRRDRDRRDDGGRQARRDAERRGRRGDHQFAWEWRRP